jgi:hypothetical protein
MDSRTESKLIEDIGYIKAKVQDIEAHAKETNGSVAALKGTVQRHEIILGKFGAGIAAVAFFLSIAFNKVWDWLWRDR